MSEIVVVERPPLARFCMDLTAEAAAGRLLPMIGRDKELEECMGILLKLTKRNPVLVGPPGTGKTAVVEGLAQRIVDGSVPEKLRGRRILALNLEALMTGTRWLGAFEENLAALLGALGEDDILFVDEIHRLVGAGTTTGNPRDACDALKPALGRGALALIGATTPAEYELIAQDGAFERRLTMVHVAEPRPRDAVLMLAARKALIEQATGTIVRFSAIEASVYLTADTIVGRMLPDKAVDVLEDACANVARRAQGDETLDRLEALIRKLGVLRTALLGDRTQERRLQSVESKLDALRTRTAKRRDLLGLQLGFESRLAALEQRRFALSEQGQRAMDSGDVVRAARIRFGDLASTETQIRELTATPRTRLPDSVVRAKDVARAVSRRTGIPLAELWPLKRRGTP